MTRIRTQPNRFVSNAGVWDLPTHEMTYDGSYWNITFSESLVSLHRESLGISPPEVFKVPGSSFQIPHEQVSLIVADYNNGMPELRLTDNSTANQPNHITNTPLLQIFEYLPFGTTTPFIDVIPFDNPAKAGIAKLIHRVAQADRIRLQSNENTFAISESAGNVLHVAGGNSYLCLEQTEHGPIDTSTAFSVLAYYGAGGVVVTEPTTTYNTKYYQTGVGKAEVNPNTFVVNWVFRTVPQDSDAIIIWLDTQSALGTLNDALLRPFPSNLPPLVRHISAFAGKLIVEKDAATSSYISQWFTK